MCIRDRINTIKIPESNRTVEFSVSEKFPKEMKINNRNQDTVLVDVKVYEEVNGKRKLISSPQIITRLNREATLEEFDTKVSTDNPVLKLKINPQTTVNRKGEASAESTIKPSKEASIK